MFGSQSDRFCSPPIICSVALTSILRKTAVSNSLQQTRHHVQLQHQGHVDGHRGEQGDNLRLSAGAEASNRLAATSSLSRSDNARLFRRQELVERRAEREYKRLPASVATHDGSRSPQRPRRQQCECPSGQQESDEHGILAHDLGPFELGEPQADDIVKLTCEQTHVTVRSGSVR